MNLLSLASHQLRKAAALVEKIDELKAELSATLGSTDVVNAARKIKRKMSEAGRLAMSSAARAKIAAAARRRWARAKVAGTKTL